MLNLQKMKKQILLLIVAFVASITMAFGQTNPLQQSADANRLTAAPPACLAPTPVVCPSDALHPVPGTPYEYSIAVPTNLGSGATFRYRWFVTQDPNIITTTGGVTSVTSNVEAATGSGSFVQSAVSNYNDIVGGSNLINITWKSFVHNPALPVLVVIYVEGEDGCLTNNLEVFEIQPVHAFTLDIANIASTGLPASDNHETCVSPVESAIYTAGSLTMNYGTNYLYFVVTAANFTDSWLPEFDLDGHGGRTATIEWQYPAQATVATGWNAPTVPVVASGGEGSSVGSAGECIIVRVTIAHGAEETIALLPIELAVNGTMNDPTTPGADYTNIAFEDVHHTNCLADGFENDKITQVLKPRPDINSSTPASSTDTTIQPFIPKN